jgi:hypothetical protein
MKGMFMDSTIHESCFMMPVLTGKLGLMRRYWDGANRRRAEEAQEHLKKIGVTALLAYAQCLPQGDFLVQYVRTKRDLSKTLMEAVTYEMPYSRYVREEFIRFSGMDLAKEKSKPKIEMLMGWEDCNWHLNIDTKPSVFALPVRTEKLQELKSSIDIMKGPAMNDTVKRYQALDIHKALFFHQQLAEGDFLVYYLDSIDTPGKVLTKAVTANLPGSNFLHERMLSITGVDLAKAEDVIRIDLLYDWDDKSGLRTADLQLASTA